MKELKLRVGSVWSCITAIVIAGMLCGTAIFTSIQYSQTQKDIANTQAQATKDSATKVSKGLSDIGYGVCQAGDYRFKTCAN